MSTPSADQLLMGGGAPSAKFNQIGAEVAGTVVATDVRQQTDFKTGEVLTWRDGSPRMMVVATLQTQERDSHDYNDDGLRRLFIKGKSLTDAVRDAVRKAGAGGLELGGWLKVAYVADGQAADRASDPPKLYLAEFTRPQQQAANEVLNRPQSRQGQQIDAGPGWQGNQPAQPQYAQGGPVGAPHQQVWQPAPPQPAQQAGGWQRPTAEPPF